MPSPQKKKDKSQRKMKRKCEDSREEHNSHRSKRRHAEVKRVKRTGSRERSRAPEYERYYVRVARKSRRSRSTDSLDSDSRYYRRSQRRYRNTSESYSDRDSCSCDDSRPPSVDDHSLEELSNIHNYSGSEDGERNPLDTSHPKSQKDGKRDPRGASRPRQEKSAERTEGNKKSDDIQITSAVSTEQKTIDDATLVLLGEEINKDSQGPAFHSVISKRWSSILQTGLGKECRQDLIKNYPAASNCQMTKSPALNPEIKSVLSATSIKKDFYQFLHQNQLSSAINAVGIALSEALEHKKEIESWPKFIQVLSDSGRILCDLQQSLSITGRSFIIPGLNPMVKSIADGSSVDTQLFGEDFPEKLKTAQAVERSSKTVVKSTANSKYRSTISTLDGRRPNFGYKLSGNNNLNWKGPPAKNFRGARQGGQKSRRSQYQQNRRTQR